MCKENIKNSLKVLSLNEMAEMEVEYKYLYTKPSFHFLNQEKSDEIICMVFGGSKNRFGLILGGKDGRLRNAYSSPFSMVDVFKYSTIEDFDSVVHKLRIFFDSSGYKEIEIKLPPCIYDEENINKLINAMMRGGFCALVPELNYHIQIANPNEYIASLHKNGKKNLNKAISAGLRIRYCDSLSDKRESYSIIESNRVSKGYYLSMTWEQVLNTLSVAPHDFFLVDLDGKSIASAIVFRVTADICQVIYWGDLVEYSEYRPINYLAYELNNYYYNQGIKILDIGPSMIDCIPNVGLCNFKESIGCKVSNKFIFHRIKETSYEKSSVD